MCNSNSIYHKKYQRDIIFLGAGASKGVGLPLMKELLNEMKIFYKVNALSQYKKEFDNFYERYIKYCNDFKVDNDSIYLEDFFTLIEDEILKNNRDNPKYAFLYNDDCENFKKDFSSLLSYYFAHESYFYRYPFKEKCQYFKNMITSSNTFITTNWDLMLESELIRSEINFDFNTIYTIPIEHDGNFKDFSLRLEEELGRKLLLKYNHIEFKKNKALKGKITILKLHGSAGWLELGARAGLSGDYVAGLQVGERFKDVFHYEVKPLMIYPSYKKQFRSEFLINIFKEAELKIKQAKSIDIVGYSLREEDVEVRKLLSILQSGDKEIRVISDDPNDKEKWDIFLGNDNYEFICKKAEEFYIIT